MPRLGSLPYLIFAVVGAPLISMALGVAIADAAAAPYLLATIGIPAGLVVAVALEAKRPVLTTGVLAVLAAGLSLAGQIALWSGVN